MELPPLRVREVLTLLGDLKPEEARVLLGQVVATLDAAELISLRKHLPLAAAHCLPSCVGAVTVMNTAPMPWELDPLPAPAPTPLNPPEPRFDTGQLIRAALPRSRRRWLTPAAVAACSLLIGLGVVLRTSSEAPEEVATQLLPPPPATEYQPMKAPQATPKKNPVARKPAATASRNQAADWASPFERRQ